MSRRTSSESASTKQEASVEKADTNTGASIPSPSKRRRLAETTASGAPALNWNQGNQPTIRTSLGRRSARGPTTSNAPTPVSTGSDEAPLGRGASSRVDRAAEQPAPSPSEPTEIGTLHNNDDNDDDDDIDEENDSLYGGSRSIGSKPKACGGSAREAHMESEEDSDILQLHTDDELDQGVMINVSGVHELSPSALGVWAADSETPSQATKKGLIASQSVPNGDRVSSSDEGEIHSNAADPHDAMQQYADSSAPYMPVAYHPPSGPSLVLTLADIPLADLILQVRYFHIGKSPNSIPRSEPVRCLACMQMGHMASTCSTGTCSHCRSPEHFHVSCPLLIPCTRCRQTGHEEVTCTSKVRAQPEELRSQPCVLCQRPGHVEANCEVLWRSAPYPWLADLPTPGPHSFYAACYECGSENHLGNDCPERMPGKSLGSLSWSQRPCTVIPRAPLRPVAYRDRGFAPSARRNNGNFRHHSPPSETRGSSGRPRSYSPSSADGGPDRSRSRSYSPPEPGNFLKAPLPAGPKGQARGGGVGGVAGRGNIRIKGVSGRNFGGAGGRGGGGAGRGRGGGLPSTRSDSGPSRGPGGSNGGGGGGGRGDKKNKRGARGNKSGERYQPMPGAAARAKAKMFQ